MKYIFSLIITFCFVFLPNLSAQNKNQREPCKYPIVEGYRFKNITLKDFRILREHFSEKLLWISNKRKRFADIYWSEKGKEDQLVYKCAIVLLPELMWPNLSGEEAKEFARYRYPALGIKKDKVESIYNLQKMQDEKKGYLKLYLSGEKKE